MTQIPNEVSDYMDVFHANDVVTINYIERYENIYAVSFTIDNESKVAYIPVSKEKRMSDSEGCG